MISTAASNVFKAIVKFSRIEHLIFTVATLFVILPLLAPGFIIHFDMVFSPNVHFDLDQVTSGFHLYSSPMSDVIFYGLNVFLPMHIIQKIVIFSVLYFSAFFMCRYSPAKNRIVRILSGLFYAFNPFVYDRLMAGHWKFLVIYALLPLFFHLSQRLYSKTNERNLWLKVSSVWSIAAAFAPHALVIYGILFFVLAALNTRTKTGLFAVTRVLIAVIIFTSWWVLPGLLSDGVTGTFSLAHLQAFGSRADTEYGIWFTLLSLQGFWHQGWMSIKDYVAIWPLLTLSWVSLAAIGFGGSSKSDKAIFRSAIALAVVASLSLWLAAGLSPDTSQINSWIFQEVPGFSGMREPQKFLALLVFALAYLISIGLETIISFLKGRSRWLAVGVFSVVVLLGAWPMAWGGHGELTTSQYPSSWHEFERYIDQAQTEDIKVIALPWSLYVSNEFSDSLVAHPAKAYFGETAITSNDINLAGVNEFSSPERDRIRDSVKNKDYSALVSAADQLGAKYVLVPLSETAVFAWLLDGRDDDVLFMDSYFVVSRLTSE